MLVLIVSNLILFTSSVIGSDSSLWDEDFYTVTHNTKVYNLFLFIDLFYSTLQYRDFLSL